MSTMNLLPDYYVKRRLRNRFDLVCVVLFAIVMAVMIGTDKYSSRQNRIIQAENIKVNAKFTEAANFLKNDFFQLQGCKGAMLKNAQAVAEKEERIPRSYILAVITNACPESLSLSELLLTTREPTKQKNKRGRVVKRVKTGAKSAEAQEDKPKPPPIIEVKLQGVAKTDSVVTGLYSVLKFHPLVKKVDLQYTREEGADAKASRRSGSQKKTPVEDEVPLREFAIHMELHSQIDVLAIIRKTNPAVAMGWEKKTPEEGVK